MSNTKEIDGVFVNLDLVRYIAARENTKTATSEYFNGSWQEGTGRFRISFVFDAFNGNGEYFREEQVCNTEYKTEEEATARIREILRLQDTQ